MNKPFLLAPAAKDYLWGGTRLNDDFKKNIDMSPLAETWECSTHKDGESTVISGAYKGMSLTKVIKDNPHFLGTNMEGKDELPILVKFIDANKDLSVQVHPTDEYAFSHENGQLGKTEMWYILDATEGASLIYGLRKNCTEEEVRKAINAGNLERYLQKVPVKKNDVFFIEAGTIHAIGAGCLIAEVQENSNLTYRLYDYDRKDKHGNKRELHIDKAIEVSNLKKASEPRQPMRVLKYRPGMASELLSRCKYFEVYRMIINTERRQQVTYQADEVSYRVLLCYKGSGTVSFDGEMISVYKGDTLFIPADSVLMTLNGQMELLDIRG